MPQLIMSEFDLLEERPMDAIVGREPSWIVRSGIAMISIVFAALLILTWFIRYPDTVHSQIVITTSLPPSKMVSKVNGQILELYVKNNQRVRQGQALLLIESSVNYHRLQALEITLSKLEGALKASAIIDFEFSALSIDQLGQLQPTLNQLVVNLKKLSLNLSSEQLTMRINNNESLSKQYRLLQQQLARKRVTWEKKLILEENLLEKKRELFAKGVVTSSDVLPVENRYLDKQLALEDINIQIKLYEVKLRELNQSLTDFKIQRIEKLQQLKASVFSSYFALTSEISLWKQHYLIRSPMDGAVSFSQFWSANQYVKQGDVVLTVANQTKEIIGKIQINPIGAGKIETGQRVDIELASFPAVEYGQLVGKVKSISLVPGEQGYLVDVSLPEELMTTYGKQLPFSPNLIGNAKVITAEKRLFERFLAKILYVFNKT